jgi:hypothetical protein
MGRSNTQNNTKAQNTKNRKQNIQKKKTKIKQIIKKHTTINQNTTKSKRLKLIAMRQQTYCTLHFLNRAS